MSPECRNCGAHLTSDFIRVFSRDGDGIDWCPWCPETVRGSGAQPREARSQRGQRYRDDV